jgi:uncharacterized protein YbbK (DUF523 family)
MIMRTNKRKQKNALISMCLVGVSCRYNATSSPVPIPAEIFNKYNLIPVCPEQLGGLATPRLPSEIQSGDGSNVLHGTADVINVNNDDVTNNFILGAEQTLKLAKKFEADCFIGQSGSPSCSCSKIYNGTFTGTLKLGLGVTAALLKQNGIKIIEH